MNNEKNIRFNVTDLDSTLPQASCNFISAKKTDTTITREFAIISCLIKSKRLSLKNINKEIDEINAKAIFL